MGAPTLSGAMGKIVPHVIHISGTRTGSQAAVAKLRMPQKCEVVAVSAVIAAKGGTQGTSTVDVKNGTTSLLSAVMDISGTAAARVDGTLTGVTTGNLGSIFAKDDELVVDLVISGGSAPTISDLSVQVDVLPL